MSAVSLMARVAAAALIAAIAAGCADDGEDGSGGAEPRSTPTPTESQASAAGKDFSAAELDIYREALSRYRALVKASRPFYSNGRASSESRRVFQEFYLDWQPRQEELRGLESNGITFDAPHEVGWYRPAAVTPEAVTIELCVAKEATSRRDGVPLPPAGPAGPYLVAIQLLRSPDNGLFKLDNAQPTGDPCDPVTPANGPVAPAPA